MRASATRFFLVLIMLLILTVAASGCSDDAADTPGPDDGTVIIEQGRVDNPDDDPNTDEPVEDFPDLKDKATVEDLVTAQSKINSYYFEQTLAYPDGHVFMQVWYKDGKMKLVSSVDGYGLNETYYDYNTRTITTYSPGSGSAYQSSFDIDSSDAPDNPLLDNYSDYEIVGSETVNRQYCMIFKTDTDDLLWVGTKYGFPVQVEFTDSLGTRLTATYKNVSINSVEDSDVNLPAAVQITSY